MSFQNYLAKYRDTHPIFIIATSLLFFISFLRAMIAISIGALLDVLGEVPLAVLLISPVVLGYVSYRLRVYLRITMMVSASLWLFSMILSLFNMDFMFRFVVVLIGFSLSLSHLVSIPRKSVFDDISWKRAILWFVISDYMLRMLNYGAEPLVTITNPILRIVSFIAIPVLGAALLYYYWNYSKEVVESKDSEHKFGVNHVGFILLIFIYMYLFLNPNVFMINAPITHTNSMLIGTSMLIISLLTCSFIDEGNAISAGLSVIILLISTIMYPWNQVLYHMWFLSITSFVLLGSYLLGSQNSKGRSDPVFHSIGYLLIVVAAFLMLLYEYYIIFQIISVLLLINLIISWRSIFQGQMLNVRMFTLILIGFLLILPLFYPQSPSTSEIPADLSVLGYNLHYGTDTFSRDNIDRIVSYVGDLRPSIIGFQEVVVSSPLNGYANTYAKLIAGLEPLGYKYHAISNDGQFAIRNAIFSLYPLSNVFTVLLEPVLSYQRTVIVATANINGVSFTFASVHLTHKGPSKGTPERMEQVKMLIQRVSGDRVLLVGDFNSVPDSPEHQYIRQFYNDSWTDGPGYSSPAIDPVRKIDYIYTKGINTNNCGMTNTLISDHLPLFCDFSL